MPALNFESRWADDVRDLIKRQTIRRVRKRRPIRVKDDLMLYTGQRTKRCRKLGEGVCKSVEPIQIGVGVDGSDVRLNSRLLSLAEIASLARADGFSKIADFFNYFRKRYGLPFEGAVLIKW